MKKLLCLLISFGLMFSVYGADQWDTTDPAGTESPSDLDTLIITNNNVVDRLFADYREGLKISYASASTITVGAGQVACDDVGRATRKWRENTSATTVAWTEIDTDAEEASKTYYVYAVADTDVTTFTIEISLSPTAPDGATYYARLGSFYNNSDSDIEQIKNDDTYMLIATGTIAHGGTIPLPSGYTQSQCKWMVSCNYLKNFNSIGGSYQWTEGVQAHSCNVSPARLVTVLTYYSGSGTPDTETGTANYMIIGYK